MGLIASLKNWWRVPRTSISYTESQSAGFGTKDRENVVFFDNRFENGFAQVLHYFDSGFLSPDTTAIIFKHYAANFESITTVCEERGIEWHCFGSNRFIPLLENKLVIYPFNSAANAALVANRDCYHVLLMHGESNKVACTKPLARLYDYVLVAGNIACDRLVEFGVLTQADIDAGRAIKLGTTVMGDFDGITNASAEDDGSDSALGYFPTWEGGNEAENLCSLPVASNAIRSLASCAGLKHLVLRLHPHTGDRLHNYRDEVEVLIRTLLADGFKISYAAMNSPTRLEKHLENRFPDLNMCHFDKFNPIALKTALVDVSALETVMDAKRIPNIVLINPDKIINAPESYWKFKPGVQIAFGEAGDKAQVCAAAESHPKPDYFETLISYSDPALKTMTHDKRLEWLNKHVRTHRLWLG